MAKGAIITEKVFASIMILHEANPELNNTQIGTAFKMDASTVGKMIRCGTWENYQTFKKEKAEKGREREKARKAETQAELFSGDEKIAEEQIEMQLDPEEEILDQKPVMSDQVKMMRFQAVQADKIIAKICENNKQVLKSLEAMGYKIDRAYDLMGQILRAIRKD